MPYYYTIIFYEVSGFRIYNIHTLEYPISVGVCLLIFPKFSTQHALIPYHTFINFMKNFQPIRLIHIVCFSYSIFFAYFSLGGAELLHKLFQSVMIGQIYSPIYKNSELLRKFPPNTLLFHPICLLFFGIFPPNTVIPYHTFIFLEQMSTQYGYSIPYGY